MPNPSFEEYSECPVITGEMQSCIGWKSFAGTPDYLNSCSPNPILQIPNNFFGYQVAATGQAYVGIYTMSIDDYREVIGIQLLQSLSIGQEYHFTLKATLAYNGDGISTCYSNNIGFRFSTIGYNETQPILTDNFSHWTNQSIITDSVEWVVVSGSFVADSAYTHMAIGNFFDNNHTDTLQFEAPGKVAYYLIDDVCLSKQHDQCDLVGGVDFFEEQSITVFPNPTVGNLHISSLPQDTYKVAIFDTRGIVRLETTISSDDLIDKGLLVTSLTSGVHIVRVYSDSFQFVSTFFKSN